MQLKLSVAVGGVLVTAIPRTAKEGNDRAPEFLAVLLSEFHVCLFFFISFTKIIFYYQEVKLHQLLFFFFLSIRGL